MMVIIIINDNKSKTGGGGGGSPLISLLSSLCYVLSATINMRHNLRNLWELPMLYIYYF